ncbi:D-methionine transport system substrate-binding protein [Microbacterium resistens]|uniref:D-methionine transport system substrate-binding protein n=1 Tax=Microbacterium resistens TaxID=156977 RepID=A0ABU1S7U3_9MICO|nr:MetQ/NlpA family ABC transporter substrate-binding protein [Microbacterium resistens]MDR6865693.1 D-methionine transport system substrate-binding protein [Microbacterium resistens]
MSRRITSVLAAVAATAALAVALAGCASGSAAAPSTEPTGSSDKPVKIGVVGKSDPQWPAFVDAAKKEGITVELIDFGSYEQPNPALSEGELDLNQFQHIVYLAQYNVKSGKDLQAIGSTAIYPLGLYSKKHKDVKEIPAGGTVAVPDDASNQARALLVLQSAGLVKLKSGGTALSDLADVDTAASKVKVTALEAALIPTSLPDVDAAIINNDFVKDAGLTFADALTQDDAKDASAQPYVNIFAARAKDKDNPTYLKLVEIFQTDAAVQEGLKKASGDVGVPTVLPAADLQKVQAKVEADVKAHKG